MALLERERVMDLEKLMELQIGVHQLMEGATAASKSLEAVLGTLEGLVDQIPGEYQSGELKNLLGQIQGTLVREEYIQSDENTTKLTNLLIERIPAIDKEEGARQIQNAETVERLKKRVESLTEFVENGAMQLSYPNFQARTKMCRLYEKAPGGMQALTQEEGAMLYGIQPGHLMVDEPVDACTGNYLYEKTDLFLPGATPLAFGRTYNSLDKSKGFLGRGWRHSFEESLQIKDNKYTVELNDGRKLLVTKTELKIYETGYCYHGGEEFLLWFDRAGNCMAKCSRGNLYFYKRDQEGRLMKVITAKGNSISISYQSDGRIGGITDHSGRSIIYCYEKKRLSSVTGPGENTENYTYEEQNRLHTVTDADGICLVSNVYDSRKRVISQNYFSAGKNSFVYQDESKSTRMQELRESTLICQTDKRKNLQKIIRQSPEGKVLVEERYDYDQEGRCKCYIDALGNETKYRYDTKGRILQTENPDGTGRQITYHSAGKMLSCLRGDGSTLYAEYGKEGDLKKKVDGTGIETTYTYNEENRLANIFLQGDKLAGFTYDEKGNLIHIHKAGNQNYILDYDKLNRLCAVSEKNGNKTLLSYDRYNHVTGITAPDGGKIMLTHTPAGRLQTVQFPDGSKVDHVYNSEGRLYQRRERDGVLSEFNYGKGGDILSIIRKKGKERAILQYTHDSMGYHTSSRRESGRQTDYTYDKAGNCLSYQEADTHFAFTYDACSRIKSITKNTERGIDFSYDGEGRLTKLLKETGESVEFTYDGEGHVLQAKDTGGRKLEQSYDSLGRPVTVCETDETGCQKKICYTYGENGNLCKENHSRKKKGEKNFQNTQNITYTYDDKGNSIGRSLKGGGQEHYSYDVCGRLIKRTDSNHGTTSFRYDLCGRLVQKTDTRGNNFTYTYDGAGRILSVEDPVGNKTTYKYNLFGILEGQKREGEEFRTDRLPAPLPLDILLSDLEEEELLPTGKLCLKEERDCIGRPIRRTYSGGITATCSYTSSGMPAHLSYQDNRGELDTFHYTYDGENCLIGIRAWRREMPEESSVCTYKYDALSRLTEVFKNGTLQRRYTYDARGNRTVLLTREEKETYSYDSGDRLQERTVTSFQNQSIVKTYRYRYDEIGSMYEEGENLTKEKEMETQIPVSSLGAEELVLTDHLGSPLRRIDGRGKITGSYAYDEFGRLRYREGQMPEKGYGGYRAREDGTLQAGIRVYDPQLGRFHSPDPVSAPPEEPWNNNPYVYVWNNPLTHMDRTGAYGKSISGLPVYVTGNGSQSTAMPYPAAVQDPNGEAAKMYRGQAVSGCRKSFTEQLFYEIEEYSSHGITSGLFQEGIPLFSSIDQFLRGVGIGLFKGLYEMITGIIQLPATLLQLGINITVNPLETIEAMGKGTWYGVKQAIFEDFIYGDASSRGERVGRLIPDIVLLLAGVGEINAAKNISRGAETAEDAAKIAGFADEAVDATKMKGVIEGASGTSKTVSTQGAESVNKTFPKGYEPPYKPGTQTKVIELTQNTKLGEFVRVYDNVNSGQAGGWLMKGEDIAGLTPQQIQNKFALPTTPTHVTDVTLKAGTQLRTGTANGLFGYEGGGIQFDMMGQRIGEFTNGRLLP